MVTIWQREEMNYINSLPRLAVFVTGKRELIVQEVS